MNKGILLNQENDLKIEKGTIAIGDTLMQDAYNTLSLTQGELKDDPMTGVNLVRMIRGKVNTEKMRKVIEIGLQRVGIQFEDVRKQIEIAVNGEIIG